VCVFLVQGEDVVAGIRTPEDLDTMKEQMPQAYAELVENCNILEGHYKDMMVPYSLLHFQPLLHHIFLAIFKHDLFTNLQNTRILMFFLKGARILMFLHCVV
jgi:hypothetical protein